jgi:hypothetical protein
MTVKVKKYIYSGLIGLVVFLLASFWMHSRGKKELPVYAKRTAEVKSAYQYSLEDVQLLNKLPCYCNCHQLGHKNVHDCFIRRMKDNGRAVFNKHGSDCGICYSIVLEAKQLKKEGKKNLEIREVIDSKYSKYGEGTNTPKLQNE